MASCSSRSVRDRERQNRDVDTYQALTVCILAGDICKSPFSISWPAAAHPRSPGLSAGGLELETRHLWLGEINHHDGGRGVYFEDPNGHLLEIITRPYGSGGWNP